MPMSCEVAGMLSITPPWPMGTTMRRIDTALGGNRIVTRTCASFLPGMEPSDAALRRTAAVHRQKFADRYPALKDVKIGEDLALTLYPTQKPPAVTTAAMADPGCDYFMVRARPELPAASQHTARRWVVLHDTSASRSPTELAAQTRFLRHLLRELDEADRLTLLAFDSTVRPLPGGFSRVDKLDLPTVENFLAREGRDHVGASDLGAAVDHALALLDADAGPEAPHILYLGDGLLSTPGDAPRAALRERRAVMSPNVFPPDLRVVEATPQELPPNRVDEAQHCYVCKEKFHEIHHFYDQLCPDCAAFNFAKRTETADLSGRVALLTGGRVKIGYEAGLRLLRSGAHLVVTTRFPRDAAQRYAAEADFGGFASIVAM